MILLGPESSLCQVKAVQRNYPCLHFFSSEVYTSKAQWWLLASASFYNCNVVFCIILKTGRLTKCTTAVVANRTICVGFLPTDDGKIFHGSGVGDPFGPRCFEGDIMGCGIMFPRDYEGEILCKDPVFTENMTHGETKLTEVRQMTFVS